MESSQKQELLEVGCDYITATAAQGAACEGLYSFGRYLVRDEVQKGATARNSRTGGYFTESAGSCSVGRRYDGVCVRASGIVAREHWFQISDISQKVTRFDVQVTDRTNVKPAERLSRIWKKNPGYTSGSGRRSEIKMVVGRNGAEIMRVASRQSERYLRIYDKGLDSGDEWYRGALRVELELKGDAAIAYVNELCTKENEQEFFYATIATFLLVRLEIAASADNLRWSALERTLCSNQPPCADVCNTTLSWLANSVQPSIDRLRRAGKLKQALETLGITRDDFEETFSINRATLEHTDSLEGPIC